jgi:DNA-directed RNA polymerase subunit RPC12/RpoP
MIDSVVNLIFRCSHKRLTRPVTPVSKDGKPHEGTYVVCLDCGKQFSYDLNEMSIGKPLSTSAGAGVLPPGMPGPRASKLKLAMMAAALPLGIAIGSMLSSKRQRTQLPDKERDDPAKQDPKPDPKSDRPV